MSAYSRRWMAKWSRRGGVDRGFFLRVKPLDGPIDMRHLLRGGEVKPWLMRELERLQLALTDGGRNHAELWPMAACRWPILPPPIRRPVGTPSAARCFWSLENANEVVTQRREASLRKACSF